MKGYNISSALQKVGCFRSLKISRPLTRQQILGFQAAFRPSLPYFGSFSAMSSISSNNQDVDRIITYWFGGSEPQKKWFSGGPAVDAEIKDQFSDLIDKARASQLNSWTEKPQSTLALLILLDQFSRNVFRGSPLSFSSDSMAVNITIEALAKGFDQQVPEIYQQSFFYLPLMHDERLISQVAAVAVYDSLVARSDPESEAGKLWNQSKTWGERHRDVILKFGRFPSRNEALGRESTPEEIEYLKEHPSGF
jgi:uncharacterized protein (DUF924 family)